MSDIKNIRNISNMYNDWFLDYASYVILERAIPNIDDGLKPVQRRLLYSMKELHDGRYHKVANIIGNTMQYHPHGDKAIGDALVVLGQKDLLIDTQGNWGDIQTGDNAAASRYIEARLTEFASTILFNNNITNWQDSYDGRKKEPIELPVRFPLLLSQGVEGIAVGMSTKILPHNFNELIKASIAIIKEKTFKVYPDFQTGGLIDIDQYNNGKRGGKVRVRSQIDIIDKSTIKISSVPYSITTSSLIDSILKANENGKIKIKKIEDNTTSAVDIIIHLFKGISPNVTIDALYAFTNCEISISTNCCVIVNKKPQFLSINELLKISTEKTIELLKKDLEYNLNSLNKQLHKLSLEQIFIEHKIYRKIENCETLDSIIKVIAENLNQFTNKLKGNITNDDILALIEIKIKRITKYNSLKHIEKIESIKDEIEETINNIKHIKAFAIRYFEFLLKKFGENKKRKSIISSFDSISVRRVAVANQKLYINRKEGFVGTSLKSDEFISKCSNLDNIIIFLENGNYVITQIEEKKYIGKGIIYAGVWKKNDKHMVYNVAYLNKISKKTYVKRFSVTSIVKNKVYKIGKDESQILYFTANPNSESEKINIFLHSSVKAKSKAFEYNYSSLAIKGRNSIGNILTKYKVRKISQKSIGESTLGGRKIWLDENIGRLNVEKNGEFLGSFNANDKIIIFYIDGSYELTNFDLSNRYKMNDIYLIKKFDKDKIITLLYFNGKNKNYYLKRFLIEAQTIGKRFNLISEYRGSKLILLSTIEKMMISFNYWNKKGEKLKKEIDNINVVGIKGWKAIGNIFDNKLRMSGFKIIEASSEIEFSDNVQKEEQQTLF